MLRFFFLPKNLVEKYYFDDLDRTINLGSNVPYSKSFVRVQICAV